MMRTIVALLAVIAVASANHVRISEVTRSAANAGMRRIAGFDDNVMYATTAENELKKFNFTDSNNNAVVMNFGTTNMLIAAAMNKDMDKFAAAYYRDATAAEIADLDRAQKADNTWVSASKVVVIAVYAYASGASTMSYEVTKVPVYPGMDAMMAIGAFYVHDEYLFIGVNNMYPDGDAKQNSFRNNVKQGKMLRVKAFEGADDLVSDSNPFANVAGRQMEWARGFNKAFSVAECGDSMIVVDQGAATYGELNILTKKMDYGFPLIEGDDCQQEPCTDSQKANRNTPRVYFKAPEEAADRKMNNTAQAIMKVDEHECVVFHNNMTASSFMNGRAMPLPVTDQRDVALRWYYQGMLFRDVMRKDDMTYLIGGWSANKSSVVFRVERVRPPVSGAASTIAAVAALVVAVVALLF